MFPPEPVLADAVPADMPVLLDLMRSYYEYDGHSFDERVARRGLERLFQEPSLGKAWLISQDDEPVGYLVSCFGFSLEYAARDAFIDEFYITPEYRGSGIGADALAQAETRLAALGIKALYLQVMPGNDRAEEFYRRAGFDDAGRLILTKRLDRPE